MNFALFPCPLLVMHNEPTQSCYTFCSGYAQLYGLQKGKDRTYQEALCHTKRNLHFYNISLLWLFYGRHYLLQYSISNTGNRKPKLKT